MSILWGDALGMGPAVVSARIDTLEIDAIISREASFDSDVTQNPVEDGFPVADHVTRQPLKLTMECVFSPTPMTRFGTGGDSAKMATTARELQRIYKAGEPIRITTPDAIYTDMVMTHAPLTRNVDNGLCYKIQLDFVHVRIVKQKTEDVPEGSTSEDAQGKAGKTEMDAGAANQNDIGTGMTVVDNKSVMSLETLSADKTASGSINTQKEITAYTAAAAVAVCYFGR